MTKKKIVFLSYNAGFTVLVEAIDNYFKQYDNEKNPLIFEDGNFVKILHAAIDRKYTLEDDRKEKKEYSNTSENDPISDGSRIE